MSKRLEPGKVVCVGRNYAAHAAELGNIVTSEPLLFLKPASSIVADGEPIVIPNSSTEVEFEGEIGVLVGARLRKSDAKAAVKAIKGLICLNDVTARDLQRIDAQWTRAKGFDTFCPVGPRVVPLSDLPPLEELEVMTRLNGEQRQHGYVKDMVHPIPALLAYISHVMTLEPGDLIATGTPAGVGPLKVGDRIEVEIPGVGILCNPVVEDEVL